MKIKRGYRFIGDYDGVGDFLAAVEAESCDGCEFSDPTTDFPSTGCAIAGQVWDEGDITEWTEVQAPTECSDGRIRCSARKPKDQDELPTEVAS